MRLALAATTVPSLVFVAIAVIAVEPALTDVATPVAAFTVATAGLLELQTAGPTVTPLMVAV